MNPVRDVAAELTKLKTDPTTLRKFSYTVSVALLVLGVALYFLSTREKAFLLAGVAAILTLVGLIKPRALSVPYKIWMGLAFTLGWFVSRIILCVVFYLVITPIGLILRVSGKDLLSQRIDRNASTYWMKRGMEKPRLQSYEKPF